MKRRRTTKAPRRRTSRRRTTRRRRRRATARRRNAAASTPVVLVNPSPSRRRRRRRANPSRRRRRRTRRYRVGGYSRRYPRIRNPAATWGGSLVCFGLGSLGGIVAGGCDWGADYLPVSPVLQAAALLGAGGLAAIAVSKWADTRAGSGIAGGAAALTVNRIRQIVATRGTGAGQSTAAAAAEAGAVIRRREAGAVIRDAGQTRPRGTPATMRRGQLAGPSFAQQAGAMAQARGAKYGPHSWIYGPDAGTVFVSAHNQP